MPKTHIVGMLLGIEEDWPSAFEELLRRCDVSIRYRGETHTFATDRVTIEPFDLRAVPRYSLVIDRLGWWYELPREWLKKVALMDRVQEPTVRRFALAPLVSLGIADADGELRFEHKHDDRHAGLHMITRHFRAGGIFPRERSRARPLRPAILR